MKKSQSMHHNTKIKIYDIHYTKGFRVFFSLTIVVVPHFIIDHNFELLKNQKIADIFQEFFDDIHGIQEVDMICYVIENGSNHLNLSSIFGKDLERNINYIRSSYLDSTYSSWEDITQCFFHRLNKMSKTSLSLTKLVLKERKKIEAALIEFQ